MIEFTRKNIGNEKTDSGVTANLSNCNIYSMEKQNTGSLLKPILDLYKVEPELFNQDVLPIILSQNQNQQNDEITRKQKEESDKMHHRYQKLIKNKSRKSVKKIN